MLALQARDVDVSAMRAVGYGESRPIEDNATEAGREANRRIEFTLIGGSAPSAGRAETDASAAPSAGAATAAAVAEPGPGAEKSDLAPKSANVVPKSRPKQ